jgi:hypothetical protein
MKNIDVEKFNKETQPLRENVATQKTEKYQQPKAVIKQTNTLSLLDKIKTALK